MVSIILFLIFAVITILGMPIALALIGGGTAAIIVGGDIPLEVVAQKMFNSLDSFTLSAIPFFMLAGALMSSGGIARRLINFGRSLVGWLPGGMAVVTVFTCMLFGCLCGSPTATVAAIGSIMVPALEEGGYERKFALTTMAAAGMIGTIIPPSTVMITYCSATGAPVGDMFMGGILPGIILTLLMCGVSVWYGVKMDIPRIPFSIKEVGHCTVQATGALLVPIIILGGIFSGVFTPTESAAVACAYGLILGCFIYKEIDLKELFATTTRAATTSGMIMFIVAAAGVFGLLMAREQIPMKAAELIMSISSSPITFLLLTNVMLLIVGCFMDATPAVLIIAPILMPALAFYNIDIVHFGIIMLINMCVGLITPPLGINLYVAAGLRNEKVDILINKYLLRFLIICILDLLLVTFIPGLSLGLSGRMG